jgi:hypothetical protein
MAVGRTVGKQAQSRYFGAIAGRVADVEKAAKAVHAISGQYRGLTLHFSPGLGDHRLRHTTERREHFFTMPAVGPAVEGYDLLPKEANAKIDNRNSPRAHPAPVPG